MSSRVVDISPTSSPDPGRPFLVLGRGAWLILISPKESKVSSLETTIKSEQTQLSKLDAQTTSPPLTSTPSRRRC